VPRREANVQINLSFGDIVVTVVIGFAVSLVAPLLLAKAPLLARLAADWWARRSRERARARSEKLAGELKLYRDEIADGHALMRRALALIATGISSALTSILLAVVATAAAVLLGVKQVAPPSAPDQAIQSVLSFSDTSAAVIIGALGALPSEDASASGLAIGSDLQGTA
jgi:hypothetical protein